MAMHLGLLALAVLAVLGEGVKAASEPPPIRLPLRKFHHILPSPIPRPVPVPASDAAARPNRKILGASPEIASVALGLPPVRNMSIYIYIL